MSTNQPTLFSAIHNRGIFSSHWLDNRFDKEPEWMEQKNAASEALARLTTLWKTERKRVSKYGNEQGLEYAFIQPVLEALGWKPKYQTYLQGREQDYALFVSDEALDHALGVDHKSADFWEPAAVVADAKKWDLPLDKKVGSGAKKEYPPEQIEWYLDRSRKPMGILTNGKLWRLIPRELGPHQRRFQTYYEVDLTIILDDSLNSGGLGYIAADDFLRFFLLFGPAGFVELDGRKPLVQRAVDGSSEYRLGVSEGLKSKAFDALGICIEGFLAFAPNKLDPLSDLSLCRENSFILLYRLLFILFAEDRRLLPYKVNPTYTNNRSLGKLRDEIAAIRDKVKLGGDDYSRKATSLWEHTAQLFDLIDRGHKAYGVPAYNGGLFDSEAHPFLAEKKLSDWHFARVIDNLGRAADPENPLAGLFRVDYRDLALQQLGGIYEGLLENHPKIAAERIVLYTRRHKGQLEEKYVPQSEPKPAGFTATTIDYAPGTVYLVKNKDERRTFGSYYTPDHIVEHIIRQTIDPICNEITSGIAAEIAEAISRNEAAEVIETLEDSFPIRLLKLRVLDPSMGSGHFLLAACQYLAEQIATNPYTPIGPDTGSADDALSYWKRRVIENCIYGVDLNPLAIDLAKLALWLETVAVDRPLTFLDHHLKHGNSLIGARLPRLGVLHDAKGLTATLGRGFQRKLQSFLDPLAAIRDIPSETLQNVKDKEKQFNAYRKSVEPFWQLADLWTADAAGQTVDTGLYSDTVRNLDKPVAFKALATKPEFQSALAFSHNKLQSFHWDLAFPEVFCDSDGVRAGGGFDAIIGNPPYEVLSAKESEYDPTDLKKFVSHESLYEPAIRGKQNLYKLFICRGLDLLRDGGRFGFIVPMALLGDDQSAELRRHMIAIGEFLGIEVFAHKDSPKKRVFEDAKLSTTVFSFVKGKDSGEHSFLCRLHPEKTVDAKSPSLTLTTESIPLYDPDNVTIISCSQLDWDYALRIMTSGRMARLGKFCTSYQGEVNETNEKGHTISYSDNGGELVLRGSNICQYLVRNASQGEDIYLDVSSFQGNKKKDSKAFASATPRIGFQRKAPQNNFRRIIAAEIETGSYCLDSISYVPDGQTILPPRFVLALLNSVLADWYFRIGSSNAQVNEYQFNNLPCPQFRDKATLQETALGKNVAGHISKSRCDLALPLLAPLLDSAPFSPVLMDTVVLAVGRIIDVEKRRGAMSRSDRSALAPEAQPYQDFLDELFFAMAGLTPEEVVGLRTRYEQMKKVK